MGIRKAQGAWIEDHSGRRYLDLYGNNCHHIGYAHPKLTARLKRQIDELAFVSRGFTSEASTMLAEELARRWCRPGGKVVTVPTGSAAVEVALMISRANTGRYKTISFYDSYHGRSAGALSVGGTYKDHPARLGPLLAGALHVPPFYGLTPELRKDPERAAQVSLEAMRTAFEQERDIAAVLFEPVRNSPHVAPTWYVAQVRQLCDRFGAVLIFDEIPTGLGKTGRFFNSEHSGIAPDITLLGKALGGAAVPVAAVLVDTRLDTGGDLNLGYFTHERNPLLATAALATLEIIDEEDLVARAREIGDFALAGLTGVAGRSKIIREVRGAGLMLAMDFDFEQGAQAGEMIAEYVYRTCLDAGLIAVFPRGSTLTLSAPLIISRGDMGRALQILEASVQDVERAMVAT